MTIKYTVSEQDFINFNLFHFKHSRQNKIERFFATYGIGILALVGIAAFFHDNIAALVLGVGFVVLYVILFQRFFNRTIEREAKKIIDTGRVDDFLGSQKTTLKDDHIEEVFRRSKSITKYSSVERIGYGYGCIFVYLGPVRAIIIPVVSAFSNDEQRDKFINILKEKTGKEPFGTL